MTLKNRLLLSETLSILSETLSILSETLSILSVYTKNVILDDVIRFNFCNFADRLSDFDDEKE